MPVDRYGASNLGGPILNSFYQAFAPTSFTLLGLWLIVVQTRHAEWRRSALQRRRTYAITLNFAFPGLMALLALVDVTDETVWRVSFATVAIFGAAVLASLTRVSGSGQGGNLVATAAFVTATVLYVLVALIAIAPGVLSDVGISLTALRGEGILLSLLVFLGVNVAWLLLFDEVPAD
jgi:hypothetical protein